jgi:hypothetical protein
VPRGIADVLDAYVEQPVARQGATCLLVALEPGGFLAARIALRLIEALGAMRGPVAMAACDPRAAALLGAADGASFDRSADLKVLLATEPPLRRADAILWVAAAGAMPPHCNAARWREATGTSLAVVAIGEPREDAGWQGADGVLLATLPERESLRLALGGSAPSLRPAAAAVARWLSATRNVCLSRPLGLSPLPKNERR